jgi:hypothetical protein
MPTLTIDQCMTIMGYLNMEAFSKKTLTAIDDDVVAFLNNNGYTIPIWGSGRGANNPVIGGGSQYSAMLSDKKFWNDANIQTYLGFTGQGEADDYTRNVSAPPATNTGTSSGAKINSAGDKLPSRNLGPEYFDHNGMMAKNILAIAATGNPDPVWVASAKKVAAGANYLSEFPAQLGDTYVLGNALIHPQLSSTTPTATPTPTPVATPTPTPTPTPTVVTTDEDDDEEISEVVEEEPEVVTPPSANDNFGPTPDKELAVSITTSGRSLNDATFASRATNNNGFYPYPGTLIVPLIADTQNALLQPPATAKAAPVLDLFADDADTSSVAPASTPRAQLIFTGGDMILNTPHGSYSLTSYDELQVRWVRGKEEVSGLIAKRDGEEFFRIDSLAIQPFTFTNTFQYIEGISTPGPWVAPDVLANASEVALPFIYAGPERDSDYGITTVSSSKDDYNEALNELRDNGVIFGYYGVTTKPIQASLSVYEGGLTDSDGTLRDENYWLSRVAGETSDDLDVSTSYLAVNLLMSGDTGQNSDLFVGSGEMRQETLIFPGDEQDLDLLLTPYIDNKTVIGELEIDSEGLRQLMLKEIMTSTPQNEVDDEGNPTGETTVTDATLVFENLTSSEQVKISIPNPDDEFAAKDLLGNLIRGTVESIELRSGDAAAAHEKQKILRRQERMGSNWNIRNSSKTDQNATSTIAFEKGRKYYIVGRHDGKPILLELELEF